MSQQICPSCKQEMVWTGFADQRYWYCRDCKKELNEIRPSRPDTVSDPGGWQDYQPTSDGTPPPSVLRGASPGLAAPYGGPQPHVRPGLRLHMLGGSAGNTPCYNLGPGLNHHVFNKDKHTPTGPLKCNCGSEVFAPIAKSVPHISLPPGLKVDVSRLADNLKNQSPDLGDIKVFIYDTETGEVKKP